MKLLHSTILHNITAFPPAPPASARVVFAVAGAAPPPGGEQLPLGLGSTGSFEEKAGGAV